jgi:hypothetical protein
VHVGEFQRLLNILLKDEEGFLAEGAEEVNEMANENGAQAAQAGKEIPTVGDLK